MTNVTLYPFCDNGACYILSSPSPTESYIDMAELGGRWGCHAKTAAKRFKESGGSALLLGGSTRYPLSQIIAIERESLSRFAARKTEQPKRFIEARERRRKEREERRARQAQRRKQAATTELAK